MSLSPDAGCARVLTAGVLLATAHRGLLLLLLLLPLLVHQPAEGVAPVDHLVALALHGELADQVVVGRPLQGVDEHVPAVVVVGALLLLLLLRHEEQFVGVTLDRKAGAPGAHSLLLGLAL